MLLDELDSQVNKIIKDVSWTLLLPREQVIAVFICAAFHHWTEYSHPDFESSPEELLKILKQYTPDDWKKYAEEL